MYSRRNRNGSQGSMCFSMGEKEAQKGASKGSQWLCPSGSSLDAEALREGIRGRPEPVSFTGKG